MSTGYLAESVLREDGLDLATALAATPAGLVENPQLFTGFLARPDVAAACLLAVADVAATTYADFGLAKKLANLDPVVTSGGDRLRFESFSACNGVHARFDLLADGIDSGDLRFGTTNVDINQPLRNALSAIARTELLHLSVGDDALRVSTPSASFVEREVSLPDRWVRGFAETPLLSRATNEIARLSGPAIGQFISSMSKSKLPGDDVHLAPSRGGLQKRLAAGPDTVFLAGAGRLRAAARILRFARTLRVFGSPVGTSCWVFEVPGGRFTLLLTPGAYRGFSGEGSLLTLLARPEAAEVGGALATELGWAPVIDRGDLARRTERSVDDVEAGLAWLSASGRVGYDVAEATWFHRELPIDADAVVRRNPRLVSAQRLVDADKVTSTDAGWSVVGDRGWTYDVTVDGDRVRCTCAWETEHSGSRGPCKHILAVLLLDARA